MKHICIGITAHVDAGKTTLSEAMLYPARVRSKKWGRVDHRDAFLDTFALERARGITIFSKQAEFSLPHTEVTLLDTPGHVDFLRGDGAHAAGARLRGARHQRHGRRAGAHGDAVAAARRGTASRRSCSSTRWIWTAQSDVLLLQ